MNSKHASHLLDQPAPNGATGIMNVSEAAHNSD